MLSKKDMISFDDVFPQTKGAKIKNRGELIKLAHNVATALKKENEKLIKEQQNSTSSGFFSPST